MCFNFKNHLAQRQFLTRIIIEHDCTYLQLVFNVPWWFEQWDQFTISCFDLWNRKATEERRRIWTGTFNSWGNCADQRTKQATRLMGKFYYIKHPWLFRLDHFYNKMFAFHQCLVGTKDSYHNVRSCCNRFIEICDTQLNSKGSQKSWMIIPASLRTNDMQSIIIIIIITTNHWFTHFMISSPVIWIRRCCRINVQEQFRWRNLFLLLFKCQILK